MATPTEYLEIERRFSTLHGSVERDDAAASSYLRSTFASSAVSWNDLLKKRLVVVLGEPGSGKSWEFRHRVAILQKAGKPAFLIELERLVSGDFATGFSHEDMLQFQRWRQGKETAFFFLDSVDESKIRRAADFYAALEKVLTAIGPARDRIHLFISSRISEWQPVTDRQELLTRFRSKGSDASNEDVLLVVEIEPLDRERVKKFAQSRGIVNPESFLEELDNRYAWEFARRPLDVMSLAEFWMANGRLGMLSEIIEFDVTSKLKESADRQIQFPLSEERAREGTESLAVATVLCMRQQFKVPDDSYMTAEALNATSCLPADWKPAEVKALLARPLFDSATYGQIRFHHRRIAEYLAACWFRNRMQTGCPTHVLVKQLFQEIHGAPVPRRSLIPVIAWLCVGTDRWNDEIRTRVLAGAPGIHLEHGDPEGLPLDFKRKVLSAWVERNKDRKDVWDQYSEEALRRLSEPQLVQEILRHLAIGASKEGARELLVQLVRHGRMVDCVPRLLEILRDPNESDDVRLYSMAALRDIGKPENHQQAWEILRDMAAFPRMMCSLACETLYPNAIGAEGLALLLEKPCQEHENKNSLQYNLVRHLEKHLKPEHAGALIEVLNRLVQSPPRFSMENRPTRISVAFEFLVELLPLVLTRLLACESLTEKQQGDAVESIMLLAESKPFYQNRMGGLGEIDRITRQYPALRRSFFWKTFEHTRVEDGTTPSTWTLMHTFRTIMEPNECDAGWMILDIASLQNQDHRKLLLKIALQYTPDYMIPQLQQAVANSSELLAQMREYRSLGRKGWFRRLRDRWGSVAERRHSRTMAWHRIQLHWQSFFQSWRLFWYRGRLRSGVAIGALADLCMVSSHNDSKHAPTSWDGLIRKHGTGVATAVKEGCKRAWRSFSPPLPHEKTNPNGVSAWVIVGLAGIQSAIEDGELAWDLISDDDAMLITRYAVNEMNGFPAWFHGLAEARQEPVAEVLRACVIGESQYPADREFVHDVLADLAWEGQALARFVRPTVMNCLRSGDPAHPAICEAAVTLAVKTASLPDAELAEIAVARCRQLALSDEVFPMWMAVCLQVDADAAITILEDRLPDSKKADEIVIGICATLAGGVRRNFSLIADPSYHRLAALQRLVPLVYRHVRPAEDVDHRDGEPYSADARDEAARFRGGLLTRLGNVEDPSTIEALGAISSLPELSLNRDYILHLIDQRAIAEADHRPWAPGDIRDFAQQYETAPRTDADLYHIVCNRLLDIKNDVEKSENSLREEVRLGCGETELRRWIARKLKERAKMRYTIPQEEEIDQALRPDLRAENPATNPVSIELKWADNWTLVELRERLEKQLIGQYLRDHNSRFGIYVIATDGRKKKWDSLAGKRIGFNAVVESVVERAQELAATRDDVLGLTVLGIDFRTPSGPS